MKILLTAFLAAILLASCQKEVSFQSGSSGNNGGNGNGNTSGLLVKAVAVTGAETQTTIYTYDSQKRLETMSIKGTTGGIPVDSYHKYIRDGAGRIVKVLQKVADMPGATTDTSVTIYHYPNETTMNYDYRIFVITMNMGGGFSMSTIDSAVYTYNADKMMSFHSYMSSSMLPGEIMSENKTDFSYDGSGNVTGMKTYSDIADPGGTMDLIADYTYTYANTSVNNTYMTANSAQNFALNSLPTITTNIITKMEMVSNATTPPMNVVITSSYVNGAGNKPVSATAVSATTGQPTQTTNYTFFYQ
ncbi:hypothetical protein [Terrimonas alba]|uniref:hypothetical protein n=1 Tax=Terrimonas alba TaxID=3349636 RepID=UPI0035F226D5